mgnify:CR=1 FL=1
MDNGYQIQRRFDFDAVHLDQHAIFRKQGES